MSEAVILIGAQGAGKTTLYRERFAATHAHVSLDVQGTKRREAGAIADAIAARKPYVVDNTNADATARAPYITQAKSAGYRVVGYYLDTPMRTAIWRNKNRSDKKPIPVPGLIRTYKRLQPPSVDEGFDEVHVMPPDRMLH